MAEHYIPVYVTGWEHNSLHTQSSSTGLCSAITNATRVTIDSGTKKTGSYALKVAPAATNDTWRKDVANADGMAVHVYLSALPAADMIVAHIGQTAGTDHKVGIGIRSTGVWALFHRHSAGAISWGADGPAATASAWHYVQFSEYSAGILDGDVDGTQLTRLDTSVGHAGGNLGNMFLGNDAATANTETLSMYFDDFTAWDAAANHYAGTSGATVPDFEVEMLLPTADGTHSTSASFTDSSANSPPSPDVFSYLDEQTDPNADTTYVSQTTIGAADYLEVTFGDPTHTTDSLGYWMHAGRYSDGSASVSTLTCQALEAANTTSVFSGSMNSSNDGWTSASAHYGTGHTGASPVVWTNAEIAGVKSRIGFSSDVTPTPKCTGVFIEAAFLPSASDEGGWGWHSGAAGWWQVIGD